MKKINILLLIVLSFLLTNCYEETYNIKKEDNSLLNRTGNSILRMSYNITTYLDFDVNRNELTNIDLATVNPSSEKQHVLINLLENGEVNMTIKDIKFDKEINIPNKSLPNTIPEIVKTEIIGNTASYYDSTGKKINSINVQMPLQTELVKSILELGKNFSTEDLNNPIATLQGVNFIADLNKYIESAGDNVIITNQGDDVMTIRMNLSYIDPNSTESAVLIIDKLNKRLLASRIYTDTNELLQTVYYGYDKDTKTINAIKTIQPFRLPSGHIINSITLSKFENLTFNINI